MRRSRWTNKEFCRVRKNSRRSLFIRLRTTAPPTFALTVTPSRLIFLSLALLMTIKWGVVIFLPPRERLRNSERLVRWAPLGNFSRPCDNSMFRSKSEPVLVVPKQTASYAPWPFYASGPCVPPVWPYVPETHGSFFV